MNTCRYCRAELLDGYADICEQCAHDSRPCSACDKGEPCYVLLYDSQYLQNVDAMMTGIYKG